MSIDLPEGKRRVDALVPNEAARAEIAGIGCDAGEKTLCSESAFEGRESVISSASIVGDVRIAPKIETDPNTGSI
jgi:hypothetical protein